MLFRYKILQLNYLGREKKAVFLFEGVSSISGCLGTVVLFYCGTHCIMKTCPCNEHPLTPHFYIVKLGFTGVYIIFLFLL